MITFELLVSSADTLQSLSKKIHMDTLQNSDFYVYKKLFCNLIDGDSIFASLTWEGYCLKQGPTPNRDISAAANIIFGIGDGVAGLGGINRWRQSLNRIVYVLYHATPLVLGIVSRVRYLSSPGWVWSAMGSGFASMFKWFITDWTQRQRRLHSRADGVKPRQACLIGKSVSYTLTRDGLDASREQFYH